MRGAPPPNEHTNTTIPLRETRHNWVLDNADIVTLLHAVRVEILVHNVLSKIIPESELEPFLYWLRFEWGANGNPHAHGLAYVAGNPYFEQLLRDEATREALRKQGRRDVDLLETWEQAESKVANFFDEYIREMHPAKDDHGYTLYDFIIENLQMPNKDAPQTVNLKEVLETTLAPDASNPDMEPDVTELK